MNDNRARPGSVLYFLQQLINGVTLGAMYGLIAIGYSMVYGIIGMINFAHGEIYMIGAFLSIITFTLLGILGITWVPLALLMVLLVAMAFTSAYGWTVERLAYRPLRGSFRLAPLISAIGMSIFLQNYVQLMQGATVKPLRPVVTGGFVFGAAGGFTVTVSYVQIIMIILTIVLMIGVLLPDHEHAARPGAARLPAGPDDGGPVRRQRRPHDLADLRDGRGARGGRRASWPPSTMA